MGMGRGGLAHEKGLFCSFAHVSPGVGMDSPSFYLCYEWCVLFEHWMDRVSLAGTAVTHVLSGGNLC